MSRVDGIWVRGMKPCGIKPRTHMDRCGIPARIGRIQLAFGEHDMAITVPIDGQEISASTFGAPVANEVNRMTPLVVAPTAWTNVIFQNSWVNYGSGEQNIQYRKIGDVVYLRGVMKSGGLSTVAFTLPTGFRPIASLAFAVSSAGAFGNLSVYSTGEVIPANGSTVSFHVTGVSFSITA